MALAGARHIYMYIYIPIETPVYCEKNHIDVEKDLALWFVRKQLLMALKGARHIYMYIYIPMETPYRL